MNDLTLLPYVQVAGEWFLPDDVLKLVWAKMVEERTYRDFFFDGTAKDENGFIKVCQNPNVAVHFMFNPVGEISAIGMLNNFNLNYAHAHWLCFKRIWGTKQTDEAAEKTLKYWFSLRKYEGYLFDVLLGIYPDENKHIDAFVKRAGFTVIGTIPNLLFNYWENRKMGAVFSYIERSTIWDS